MLHPVLYEMLHDETAFTRVAGEVVFEMQILPPHMSLATVRQYIWKRGDDLELVYRLRPDSNR